MQEIKFILCVHQGYELYGSDRSFAISVATLKKMYPNAKINVIIPKEGPISKLLDPVCEELIIDNNLGILRKNELKKNPFLLIYKIFNGMLSALSKSNNYDLIYINTIVVLDYVLAARFMKPITILHIREIPTGFQEKIFSKIISFSKMNLIFNSFNTKEAFTISNSLNKSVLLNGVSGFSENPVKAKKNNMVNILLIGRLVEWKGQKFFLDAINQLMKKHAYSINVRIVGEVFEDQVEYKNNLISFAKTNKLDDIIAFKSFADNPESEFLWSDIVVVPSIKPEPFGRVAIEAMSAKKCVVAANHGGLTEIIEHKKNGVLFEANNTNSFIESLIMLLDTPELICQYGEAGLLTFKKRFSEEIYQENFNSIINNIITDNMAYL